MKTRVLKVVPTLLCGGTETQFMTLGRLLDRQRFDLELACLRRWSPSNELDARDLSVSEFPIATFRSARTLLQQGRLRRKIARDRIDIVHGYNFYGNVFAIPPARLARSPVVIASIRDRGPYLTPMQKRVQRYVCRLADCVLVNAEAVRTWLVGEGYVPSNIVVIRNGVDLRRFNQPPAAGDIRGEFGIPPTAPVVAVVSRLNPLKGIEPFLDAAAILAPRFPDARYLIVGEPSVTDHVYADALARHAARAGVADRTIFAGRRQDVPALLSSVTVSVMPSLNEALSNVLLESMAAGVALVATRVGGTEEALTDGVSGLLVPPGDPGAIARAVGRLLQDADLARRLGRAAREAVAARFSMERMVRDTEQLYLGLLDRKRRYADRVSDIGSHVSSHLDAGAAGR